METVIDSPIANQLEEETETTICDDCEKNVKRRCNFWSHQVISHLRADSCLEGSSTEYLSPKNCEKTVKKQNDPSEDIVVLDNRTENIRSMPDYDARIHPCAECHLCFSSADYLHRHFVRLHAGDKRQRCAECPKAFGKRCDLRRHVTNVHRGTRPTPHQCGQCAKAFAYKSSLAIHMRHHTGERPFKCDECGKAFKDTANLQRHRRSHDARTDAPFSCVECAKVFHDSGHLRTHRIAVHKGERVFECDQCRATFTRNEHLTIHFLAHSGAKPFKCSTCDAHFGRYSYRRDHERDKHGVH